MERKLEDKVALVTGLGRKGGIGFTLAKSLAKEGCSVFFSYFHVYGEESGFDETLHKLRKEHVSVEGLKVDLSAASSAELLFAEALKKFGKVDILINNAACSENDSLSSISAESIDRHYFVNVRTPILLVREFLKFFKGEDGGRIINITSGQAVGPLPDELAYVASKAALDTFMKSAAEVLMKRGITINSVDPGATDTGWMNEEMREDFSRRSPLGRVGTPEDLARLVLFLASSDSGYITGQVIHSRGGV